MYEIHFYKDKSGQQPVKEYIAKLYKKKDKDSRIKLNKIRDYIKALSEYGTQIGEPYIKHLEGDIWELRPLRDRILFVAWNGSSFVLLHHFMKKHRKRQAERLKRQDENWQI